MSAEEQEIRTAYREGGRAIAVLARIWPAHWTDDPEVTG